MIHLMGNLILILFVLVSYPGIPFAYGLGKLFSIYEGGYSDSMMRFYLVSFLFAAPIWLGVYLGVSWCYHHLRII